MDRVISYIGVMIVAVLLAWGVASVASGVITSNMNKAAETLEMVTRR